MNKTVKQVSLKLNQEQVNILNRIADAHDYSNISSTLHHAIYAYDQNEKVASRLEALDAKINQLIDVVKNVVWRANEAYLSSEENKAVSEANQAVLTELAKFLAKGN